MDDALAPGFLISLPHLQDENFRNSVVLLLKQDEEGAMGVVINQESPLKLEELCADHAIPYAGETEKHVRRGGPVEPEQGLVLYGKEHEDPDGERVVDGLHVSASRGTLARLCTLERGQFHCYAGYAGWGPGQLEREIEEGSWVHAPADADCVLDVEPEQMWGEVLRRQGIEPGALVQGGSAEA